MLNLPLLRQVRTAVTAPEREHPGLVWDQDVFHAALTPDVVGYDEVRQDLPDDWCGTVMCIAGWACYLHGDREFAGGRFVYVEDAGEERSVDAHATALLGITDPEDTEWLFYSTKEEGLKMLDSLIARAEAMEEASHGQH